MLYVLSFKMLKKKSSFVSLRGGKKWHLLIAFFRKKYLFIWLAGSWLQYVGSLVIACKFLVVPCGICFPDQELNPGPPALGVQRLSHWTTREVPPYYFNLLFLTCQWGQASFHMFIGHSDFLLWEWSVLLYSVGYYVLCVADIFPPAIIWLWLCLPLLLFSC